jgi:ABC-2 type transport system permease protein
MFAAVGLAIAALTPRRAYATVTIIGLFIASNAIAGILFAVLRDDRGLQRWTALLSIDTILAGVTSFLFQTTDSEMANPIVRRADLPGWVYVAAALAISAVAVAIIFQRYHRVET